MSFVYTCDLCGRAINPDDYMATIAIDGRDEDGTRDLNGWLGHYHSVGCRGEVVKRVQLIHELAQTIEAIPTISGQAVAARRRKHRHDGE